MSRLPGAQKRSPAFAPAGWNGVRSVLLCSEMFHGVQRCSREGNLPDQSQDGDVARRVCFTGFFTKDRWDRHSFFFVFPGILARRVARTRMSARDRQEGMPTNACAGLRQMTNSQAPNWVIGICEFVGHWGLAIPDRLHGFGRFCPFSRTDCWN